MPLVVGYQDNCVLGVCQPHLHQHRPSASRSLNQTPPSFPGTGSWPLSMESLSPAKRGCRFKEESEGLSFHKDYSRTSCIFECTLKMALKELECVPWYLPQVAGVPPCRCEWPQIAMVIIIFASSSKTADFLNTMALVKSDSCDCLPDCESTEYQYALSSSSLR